jgi:hypothetical protein
MFRALVSILGDFWNILVTFENIYGHTALVQDSKKHSVGICKLNLPRKMAYASKQIRVTICICEKIGQIPKSELGSNITDKQPLQKPLSTIKVIYRTIGNRIGNACTYT